MPPLETLIAELVELINAGQWYQVEIKARILLTQHPGQVLGWRVLGKALTKLGEWSQAVDVFSQVIKLLPDSSDVHNDLGFALYNSGLLQEAEVSYRVALKLDPQFSEACSNLTTLLTKQGRLVEALINLQLSLKNNPDSEVLHNNLGNVLRYFNRLNESEASYRRGLELNPTYFEAYVNLGLTLKDLGKLDESLMSYRRALELDPNSDFALHGLGILLHTIGGKDDEAITCLERSISLNATNYSSYNTLGSILLRMGQTAKSLAMFRQAQEICPLTSWPARKAKADFSVVILDAPGGGCTPVHNFLIRNASYDCHIYCVLPDSPPHLDMIRAKADVVLNIIADADYCKEILPFAQDLVERLGRPTVNSPCLIMNTNRETVAQRLVDIPLCRIPKTMRLSGHLLAEALANKRLYGFTMPLLIRLAGNHGGDDFEKCDDVDAILDFISTRPEADYYLIEYVDYRSADGFFRKYRLICIDGKLFPYHLAIHDNWKVHHFRTDMANQSWMREEEKSFLRDPQLVFDAPHQAALLTVAAATKLDYSGIDCALDRDGRIVVFETNAAMLVHDETDELFAYKNPYIFRIKDAFDAMLKRLVTCGR